MKILIADDDPTSQYLLARTLKKWGYEVVVCSDGIEALKVLQENRIKLAILDWEMPGMNGIEICRYMRGIPEFSTYLLLLSARNKQTDVIEGLESGADDFIRKPFDAAELKARLKTGQRIIELEESLKEQAIRDPLTGLYNRRYMEEILGREIKRAERKGSEIGLILADIDHFKKINDSYGHQAGDLVLKIIGKFLLENVRGGDVVCRFGGEEFLLILPEASKQATVARAEKLCRDVRDCQIEYRNRQIGPISFSAGVSSFPQHGDTTDKLVHSADMALYEAKEAGRDRVVLHSEPADVSLTSTSGVFKQS